MTNPAESQEAPKVTITWTLRDFYRTTLDLSKPADRVDLHHLLRVDDDVSEDDVAALVLAAEQIEEQPEYDVQEGFAEMSSQSTWIDRDPGDCVRITNVRVE